MIFRHVRRALALAAGLSALMGCGATVAPDEEDSADDALSWRGGNEIRLATRALGKDYLLQASLIDQDVANFSHGLQSKIVRFEVQDDVLLMLEAGDGKTNAPAYQKALARFPILRATTRSIYFDFDSGMKNAFAFSADWHASDDFSGLSYDMVPFELKEAYIVEAGTHGNRFVIEQAAQFDVPDWNAGLVRYAEVIKYYLLPYAPNPSFAPMVSPGHDVVSFFEASPRLAQNSALVYNVARFDAQRPIHFSISSAVPAEFLDAVKDGVRYWNAVMGRNFVAVDDAPAGVHAPDMDRNIIEWVNWDDAGFAYADAQVDPRSGETLHAQVFMTSSWAIYARSEIFQLAAKLAAEDETALHDQAGGQHTTRLTARDKALKAYAGSARRLGLSGKLLEGRDGYADRRAFSNHLRGMTRLIEAGASEAVLLEAARDVVRNVVAHEVGHTLGLRHNFAGSAATNYGAEDVSQITEEYIAGEGRTPDEIRPTSTVMDYVTSIDDMLVGDLVEQGIALPYDVRAMKVLYDAEAVSREQTPAACDDFTGLFGMLDWGVYYVDCHLWDGGRSIVDSAVKDRNDLLDMAVSDVVSRAVAYKTDPDHPRPVAAVTFNPEMYGALAVLGGFSSNLGFWDAISLFYDVTDNWWGPTFSIPLTMARQQASYPDIGELERDDLAAQREAMLIAEVTRFGGAEELFAPPAQEWIDAQTTRLEALLANASITSGTGPRGTAYSLTEEELDSLRSKGRELLAAIPKHYFARMVTGFTITYTPRGGASLPVLAEARAVLGRAGVFAATHEVLTATVTLTSSDGESFDKVVHLPVPLFRQEDRIAAAGLMGGDAPESDWLTGAQQGLLSDLDDFILATFGIPQDQLLTQLDSIPHPARRWTQDLLAVRDALAVYSPL